MAKVLVVDDEMAVRYSFTRAFGDDYEIITAENGLEGYEKATTLKPDVVLLDIKMPVLNGIDALQKIKKSCPQMPVIMMTAFGDTNLAIETMKYGAYDYVTKPFDNKELKVLIDKAISSVEIASDGEFFKVSEDIASTDRIVGKSNAILNVCKTIGQIANSEMPVLICGESGVGKELVAQAIHRHSSRQNKPFVAFNCASLPDNLIESELFGYEQGAFTGAVKKRLGLFEHCSGGTLFLDEIGDMSLSAQSKVLRVLQDATFVRLGGHQTIKADVRIIAATNKDLLEEVAKGNFRQDLYHRLNVISIYIPPLRERKEDIPVLTEYFVQRASAQMGKTIKGISAEAMSLLQGHVYTGNVRELENTIRRAVAVAKGSIINLEDIVLLPHDIAKSISEALQGIVDNVLLSSEDKPYDTIISAVERLLVKRALELSNWSQVKASAMLGITRVTLRKKIEDYHIDQCIESIQ